jgi:hypothetical protein
VRSAQKAFVVPGERIHVTGHLCSWQESVAHWRNNQIADQRIGCCQCLLDTATVGAVGNVEFCSNFLMRQGNQSIAND